jgi:hypothetical protein
MAIGFARISALGALGRARFVLDCPSFEREDQTIEIVKEFVLSFCPCGPMEGGPTANFIVMYTTPQDNRTKAHFLV